MKNDEQDKMWQETRDAAYRPEHESEPESNGSVRDSIIGSGDPVSVTLGEEPEPVPAQTPIEDLRQAALKHYEEMSNQTCSWASVVPKAINYYFDHCKPAKPEPQGTPGIVDPERDFLVSKPSEAAPMKCPDETEVAARLALWCANHFYPEQEFVLLNDLSGILSQIDNMLVGIYRRTLPTDARTIFDALESDIAEIPLHSNRVQIRNDALALIQFARTRLERNNP